MKKKESVIYRIFIKTYCIIASAMLFVGLVWFIVALYTGDFVTEDGMGEFELEEYNVTLDVREDNKVYVTEEITVDRKDRKKKRARGITMLIPQWQEYTGKDGKTITRRSHIKNLKSESDPFKHPTTTRKYKEIEVGDKYEIAPLGIKTYIISYEYDMGSDPFKGYDEFIYHVFENNWNIEIKKASISIKMPKSLEEYDVNFFIDKKRENNVNEYVKYNVTDKNIYAYFDNERFKKEQQKDLKDSKKGLRGALTVDIELPENYFNGGSNNYGWISFVIIVVLLALTGYNFLRWFKNGKNYKRRKLTIEYYPPDDYDSATICYIYKYNKRINSATILQLATKGYIKIDKLANGKFQITGAHDILELKSLTVIEQAICKKLFKDDKVIIIEKNKKLSKTLSEAFSKAYNILSTKVGKKIYSDNNGTNCFLSVVITVAVLILHIVSFCLFDDLKPSLAILHRVTYACIYVNIFLCIIMGRRTEFGEELFARVKGFRKTLKNMEKSKLEELLLQKPLYYYDILPYSCALNMSKEWIEKFDKVSIHDKDIGNFDYSSLTEIDLLVKAIDRYSKV